MGPQLLVSGEFNNQTHTNVHNGDEKIVLLSRLSFISKNKNMKTLLNIPKKLDIIIVGTKLEGYPSFSTTDDYDSITLKALDSDGTGVYLETDGFVTVIPVKEFIKMYDKPDFIEYDIIDSSEEYFIILENQQGDISVQLLEEDTGNDITPEDLDFEDYVKYQNHKGELDEVRLIFEKSAKARKFSLEELTDYLNLTPLE